MKTQLLILILSVLYLQAFTQKNIGGKPSSFDKQLKVKNIARTDRAKVILSEYDVMGLTNPDNILNNKKDVFRYGTPVKVSLNLNNCGEWHELDNGDRIWKLTINCPGAKSIRLTYDKFFIPKGAVMYLYDKNKENILGGFNEKNNQGTRQSPSKFSTGQIFNDEIIVEYFEPKASQNEGEISISKVIYGFTEQQQLIVGESESGTASEMCSININCSPEGDDWQAEKTSVVKIIMSSHYCTGALIMNTNIDNTPYLLTANHCLEAEGLDAVSNNDASDFIFVWNFEAVDCEGTKTSKTQTTNGAIVVANDAFSDFALLRLSESPYDLEPPYEAYFNGWDRGTTPKGPCIGIHHPLGENKKISIDNNDPFTGTESWYTVWDETQNGRSITYRSSSGSPLFNNFSRIIGQGWHLVGTDCESAGTAYGRFDVSWDHGSIPQRRLKDWLDPGNTNAMYMDGRYYCDHVNLANQTISTDETIEGCKVNIHDVTVENNTNVTIKYTDYLIIGKNFEANRNFTITKE